ncbi:MarR family transcriptional regulator [Peribacillus sp. NPDC094092]|uniref:MarR family transcriptional regulator n=1 Tax=Peribacillus sp. NPDC094092 TaxID=3390611 RepID=UPI003D07B64B
MTYVIDKLEQKGVLSRNACPDDRRMLHVRLTDDGQMMNEIMPKYHELVEGMFDH